ncbi:MAG: type II toxin-antitoxin system RelE/ParE family toxin [Burkholderiaceae bacterium]
MLPISWSAAALEDLNTIIRHIADVDVHAALAMHEVIENSVLPVSDYPYVYRPGRVPGTREVIAHPNYIVVCEVQTDRVNVLAVMHTRQQFP